jgi:hypothetical protein
MGSKVSGWHKKEGPRVTAHQIWLRKLDSRFESEKWVGYEGFKNAVPWRHRCYRQGAKQIDIYKKISLDPNWITLKTKLRISFNCKSCSQKRRTEERNARGS